MGSTKTLEVCKTTDNRGTVGGGARHDTNNQRVHTNNEAGAEGICAWIQLAYTRPKAMGERTASNIADTASVPKHHKHVP